MSYKIEIQRRKNSRRMSLKVYPNGKIVLSTNISAQKNHYLLFLEKNKDWLDKKIQKINLNQDHFRPKNFVEGEVLPFLGRDYKIKIKLDTKEVFSIDQNTFLWSVDLETQERYQNDREIFIKKLRAALRDVAEKVISKRVSELAQKTGLFPKELNIKELNSMWGNCYPHTGKININWKLIIFDISVIDYVIIHELSHLVYANHSKSFWELVQKHVPEFKKYKKILRENNYKVDFLKVPSYLR